MCNLALRVFGPIPALVAIALACSIPSAALAQAAFSGPVDLLEGQFSWTGTFSLDTNINDPSSSASGTANISFNGGSASVTAVSGIETWNAGAIELSNFVLNSSGHSTSSDSGTFFIDLPSPVPDVAVDWSAETEIQTVTLRQTPGVVTLQVYPLFAPDYGPNSPGLGPWGGVVILPVDLEVSGETVVEAYGISSDPIPWGPIPANNLTVAFAFELQRDTPGGETVLTAFIPTGGGFTVNIPPALLPAQTETFPPCEVVEPIFGFCVFDLVSATFDVNTLQVELDGASFSLTSASEIQPVDPTVADSDRDGFIDFFETNTGVYVSPTDTGTDPQNFDTDGDGLSDGAEVSYGSDPNEKEGDIVFQHLGSAGPTAEGWGEAGGGVGTVSGPINDSGFAAWRVDDNSTQSGSTKSYDHQQPPPPAGYGWVLRSRLRVIDTAPDPVTDNASVHVEYSNGSTAWAMNLRRNANGDPVVFLFGGSPVVLTGLGDGYHLYELVFDPFASPPSADLFVNGQERSSDYAGAPFVQDRVTWGSSQSSTTGEGRYNLAEWTILDGSADRDHDGLSDADETGLGTDPIDPDTDLDGLLDGFEVAHGFDPFVGGEQTGDPDGDGLDNLAEQAAGTDPHDSDSDDDTLLDGFEVASGLDPLDADPDGDGLLDFFEVAHGFDPFDGDEDENGRADGMDDPDLDGLGNLGEQAAATDPLDPDTDDDGLLDGAEISTGVFGPPQLIASFVQGVHVARSTDMDGDGDLDVVSGSLEDAGVTWHENTDGLGSFSPKHPVSGAATPTTNAFVADVDGDGDPDVISTTFIGPTSHELAWYENTDGAGSFGPKQVISTLLDDAQSVFAADLDGDGDADVLSASFDDDKIAWYENTDGSGSFGPQQEISSQVFPMSIQGPIWVVAEDLDGDGDLDVVGAAWLGDEIVWYENTDGAGSFGPKRVIATGVDEAWRVAAADVDGDGDADILSSSRGEGTIAWYENVDGSGTFGAQRVISTLHDIPRSVAAVDIDWDGDLDLLATALLDDTVEWYENLDGAGSFGPARVISNATDGASWAIGADVDGDGDADVLSTTILGDQAFWHENLDLADPLDPDSDDDGLLDGVEVANGYDPLTFEVDHDGDGVGTFTELVTGTNAANPDSDGDGSSDGADNCRLVGNASQADDDGDGRGDGCDYNDPVDLADASVRTVVVQFELSLDPTVVGAIFDDEQLPASYEASGNLRTVTIGAADFEAYLAAAQAFGFDPGTPSDYVITIDASTGELLSADWSAELAGDLWMAHADSSVVGGYSILPAFGPTPIFCDEPLDGPCDFSIATSSYDAATGRIAGLGGIDVPGFNGEPAPNDRLNPLTDLRLAELAGPLVTIGFEGVAAAGEEVLFSPAYDEDVFDLTGSFGADPDFHVLSASVPGVGVTGSDFGLVADDPTFVLADMNGLPFVLVGLDAAQAFGEPGGTVTVTGTRLGGTIVQTTLATTTDSWTAFSFGPEWSGLTSVAFASDQDLLAVDDIDVVPVAVPEPEVWLGLVAGIGFLLLAARRNEALAAAALPDSLQ